MKKIEKNVSESNKAERLVNRIVDGIYLIVDSVDLHIDAVAAPGPLSPERREKVVDAKFRSLAKKVDAAFNGDVDKFVKMFVDKFRARLVELVSELEFEDLIDMPGVYNFLGGVIEHMDD